MSDNENKGSAVPGIIGGAAGLAAGGAIAYNGLGPIEGIKKNTIRGAIDAIEGAGAPAFAEGQKLAGVKGKIAEIISAGPKTATENLVAGSSIKYQLDGAKATIAASKIEGAVVEKEVLKKAQATLKDAYKAIGAELKGDHAIWKNFTKSQYGRVAIGALVGTAVLAGGANLMFGHGKKAAERDTGPAQAGGRA